MYYVVGKYRIVVESETPVNMKDYPDHELIEGAPGIDLLHFEVYEDEKGKKCVKTKIREPFDLKVTMISPLKEIAGNVYEIKGDIEPIEIKLELIGISYIPPIVTLPPGFEKDQISISCTRGKLSTSKLIRSGTFTWKPPPDETIDAALQFVVMNFPPINKAMNFKIIA